ncbi:MAG: tetratricopeptide repeat protein, partial [Anaerolineae bacterium]|nr:tetratricopeptide repeat protein [Anaerolineae bacterium]
MALSSLIAGIIEESYALKRSGDIGAALRRAREALEKARAFDEDESIAAALVCIARILYYLGHYDEAQCRAEEALLHAGFQAHARADALRLLGDCAHEAGDLTTAESYYRRAIDLSRQLGYTYSLHRCLHSLAACIYIPRGQFDLALASDEESLRLAIDLEVLEDAWLPLVTIGWVYFVTGRRERALEAIEEMERFVQPGSRAEGYWFCLRADLAQLDTPPASALPFYARARAIAEAIGDPGLGAELRVGLSRYHRTTGNSSTAYEWADDALCIASRAGCRDVQGWALIERARAAWALGDTTAAEADFQAAIELLTPMEAQFDLARAYFLLAALFHRQQRAEAGSAWIEAVSRIISGGYTFLLEQERALAFPLLAVHLNSDRSSVVSISETLLSHLERVPPPSLHVVTLGRFEVRQGTRTIPDQAWRKRRAGELFRLLLISPGRSLFRDQVAEALWPEKSPGSTPALFHKATSALRHAMEPDLPDKFPSRYVAVEEKRITLRLPPNSLIDFEAFERHIRAEEWEEALQLYQGELFPEDRYADWAVVQRERLAQDYVRVALAAARGWFAGGRFDEVL